MNRPKILRTTVLDFIIIAIGAAIYALAFDIFLDPNSISPGGASGLAMVINRLVPVLPVGTLMLIINTPLFLMGLKVEGKGFLIKSLWGTVVSSVLIDLFANGYQYTEDPLMAALAGGVMSGAGLGLVFLRGATTGGSDIAAKLLTYKFPGLGVGRLMLAVDVCVVALGVIVFGRITYALYAGVVIFLTSNVIDGILDGTESARVAYIITKSVDAVVDAIDRELDRGATLLHGEGSYTHTPTNVILCAIKRRQIADLKKVVREVDPSSFVIIMDAHEVLGDGFRSHTKQ